MKKASQNLDEQNNKVEIKKQFAVISVDEESQ